MLLLDRVYRLHVPLTTALVGQDFSLPEPGNPTKRITAMRSVISFSKPYLSFFISGNCVKPSFFVNAFQSHKYKAAAKKIMKIATQSKNLNLRSCILLLSPELLNPLNSKAMAWPSLFFIRAARELRARTL